MMDYGHLPFAAAVAASTLLIAAGCSTTGPAPFHMYSSPLLEGEMEPGDTGTTDDPDARAGVEPRQVYAYQRWHSDAVTSARTATARDNGQRGGFDTVHAPDEPVLANYEPNPSGEGGTGADGSAPSDHSRTGKDNSISDGVSYGDPADSAGYIYDTLTVNGIEFDDDAASSIPRLYRNCRTEGETFQTGEPNIGDLVFFHNTFDANDDGRNNDWYTLVGIIERISSDGTVTFLAYTGSTVETLKMNLDQLDRHHRRGGEVVNSRLRDETPDDPPYTQYLAGQLFAGYCDVLGEQAELILIDRWTPDSPLQDGQARR